MGTAPGHPAVLRGAAVPIPIPSLSPPHPHPISLPSHPALVSLQKPTCSPEHIELVASCLDDHNRDTKIQALNTLRAFVTRSLFTDKIRVSASPPYTPLCPPTVAGCARLPDRPPIPSPQDYYPKILDMVTCSRDVGVHLAALQLLNALPVPPNIEPLLRRTVPNLLGFLQLDNHNIQVRCPPCPVGTPMHRAHPPSLIPGVSAAAGPQAAGHAVPHGRAPARHPQLPGTAPGPAPGGFCRGFASSFPPWGCPQAWPLSPSTSSTRFVPKS